MVEYAECQDCGGYCCSAYDVTPLRGDEIQNISNYLGLSETEFRARYVETYEGHPSSPEFLRMPCPLQVAGRCSVHPVKPEGCALYNPGTAPTAEQALDFEGNKIVSCPEWHRAQVQLKKLKKEKDSK